MKLHFVGVCNLALTASCKTSKTSDYKYITPLAAKIDSIANVNQFNGVILLAKDAVIQYQKAFGYADLENNVVQSSHNQ